MSALETVEAVVLTLAVLLLVLLALVWVRRRAIAGGKPLMLCALRTEPETPWRLGLLRFNSNTMDWFSVIGLTLRPACRWERWGVDLAPPGPAAELIPGLPEAVAVRGHCRDDVMEFAMSPASYTALRSWLESSPPGFNVNVA
jgi:hypothetical protein